MKTTPAVREIAKADSEQHITYSVLGGDILNDETLAGKAVFVPTVPGKNVHFASYYPDGQLKYKLDTDRSIVTEAMFNGIASVDAAKFAEDAARREWVTQERRELLEAIPGLVRQFAPLGGGGGAASSQVSDIKALIKSLIEEEVKKQLPPK